MADEVISGMAPQLVVCGSIAIDRIMNFKGLYRDLIHPDKLHVLSVSMLLDKLESSRGGIGANIASCLAQLGDTPYLIGSVGRDAELYIEDLKSIGVDVSGVHFSDLPTASFNVITDSEDNQVGGFYQGAMRDSNDVSFKPWQGQPVMAMVCAHNPDAMNRQVIECQEMGMRLVYDPGQQVSNDSVDLANGVAVAEIIFVNDYELSALCTKLGVTPEGLKSQVPFLVTTFGKQGSLIEGNHVSEPLKIGVIEVNAVDPTGAGDAYRAGFLYGYLRQWDLKTCGQLGATVASFIVEEHGTQQMFSKQAVQERYRANFDEEVNL